MTNPASLAKETAEAIRTRLPLGSTWGPEGAWHAMVKSIILDALLRAASGHTPAQTQEDAYRELMLSIKPPEDCPFCTTTEPCGACMETARVQGFIKSRMASIAARTGLPAAPVRPRPPEEQP